MTFEELKALRAAIPDDGQLPAGTTREELEAVQRRRIGLDRRLIQARDAADELARLGDFDPEWEGHLNRWRPPLCAELLALPRRIRDDRTLGLQRNLTLSIRCIDFGIDVLKDSGYSLATLRLGELMRADGFEPAGGNPDANFVGTMPWFGSLRDVERRRKDYERRRSQAEDALADALMDDDERARRAAEAKARIAALNAQPVRKTRNDGSQYDKYPDGRRVEVSV